MIQLINTLRVSPDFRVRFCAVLDSLNSARRPDRKKRYNLIHWEYREGELLYVFGVQENNSMTFTVEEEKRSAQEIEQAFRERIAAAKSNAPYISYLKKKDTKESAGFMRVEIEIKKGEIRKELVVKEFTAPTDARAGLLCAAMLKAGKIMEVYEMNGTVDARYQSIFEQNGYAVEPGENGGVMVRKHVYFSGGLFVDLFSIGRRLLFWVVTLGLELHYKKKLGKVAGGKPTIS